MAEQQQKQQKKTSKAIDIWKKKKWFKIFAPEILQKAVMGETPAFEAKELVGRPVAVNLMTITGNARQQDINLSFRITKATPEGGETELIGYEILPAAIKRVVRGKKTRIDDSFLCKTKDGKVVRIKTFLLATNQVNRSMETLLRREAREALVRMAADADFDALVQMAVEERLQKPVREQLHKYHPLSVCDIRKLELVLDEKITGKIEAPKPERKKIEEKKSSLEEKGEAREKRPEKAAAEA